MSSMSNHSQAPFGCYGAAELEALRAQVRATPLKWQEYERQATLSEQFIQAEQASSLEELGSFRTVPHVFKTPARAAYLHISLHIMGPGSVRIQGIQLTHSERGIPVPLSDSHLQENLKGWHIFTPEGASVQSIPYLSMEAFAKTSGVTPTGSSAQAVWGSCLWASNPAEAPIILTYEQPVTVQPEQYYSIQTLLSLKVPDMASIRVEAAFTDLHHQTVGEAERSAPFHRSTPTNWSFLLEATGADANRYMMEQEPRYARSCADKLLYMLKDMKQGMDIFRATGWHDDDVYGAVHIGRGMAVTSVLYGQIAGADVLSSSERQQILEDYRYIAAMMMDTKYYRYDLLEFPDEKGGMRSNWNADRATGLGVYALLFPDEKDTDRYLEHARAVVEWQLENVVDDSGAWPENIRYHGAVIHRYFLFFALLKRLRGIDYFQHEKVQQMYRFLISSAITFDNAVNVGAPDTGPRLVTPAVGDANVHEQWFRLLLYAAPFFAEINPQLAAEMMWAWQHGGMSLRDNGASTYPIVSLLYPQLDLPVQAPVLDSQHYPDIGYVIFRDQWQEPYKSHYMLYEASPLTYHAHHDEGHFSIWAESVPLTLDSGTGGYYNGDRHWYLSSSAHNVVQFTDADGILQNGPLRSTCDTVYFSEELDYVSSTIPDELARSYRRHIAWVKADWHVYLIWDQIDSDHDSVWNLHTLSEHADLAAQRITAYGLQGMCLDTMIASPQAPVITSDVGAIGGGYELGAQQHFRVHGTAGQDYITLLHPRRQDSPPLVVNALHDVTLPEGIHMYQLRSHDGRELVYVLNASKLGQEVPFALEGKFRLLTAERDQPAFDNLYTADRKLPIGANQIHIFSKEDVQS